MVNTSVLPFHCSHSQAKYEKPSHWIPYLFSPFCFYKPHSTTTITGKEVSWTKYSSGFWLIFYPCVCCLANQLRKIYVFWSSFMGSGFDISPFKIHRHECSNVLFTRINILFSNIRGFTTQASPHCKCKRLIMLQLFRSSYVLCLSLFLTQFRYVFGHDENVDIQ